MQDAVKLVQEVAPRLARVQGELVKDKFNDLVGAVATAGEYLEAIGQRLTKDRSVFDRLKGMVLSAGDATKIATVTTKVEKAVAKLQLAVTAMLQLQATSSELDILRKLLRPVRFDTEIAAHLNVFVRGSRGWLFTEVIFRLDAPAAVGKKNNLIWLRAEAGMGKSAFSAALIARLKDSKQLLGAALFTFSDAQRSNPFVLVMSLAFQVAEAFPEIAKKVADAAAALRLDENQPDLGQLFQSVLLEPLESLAVTDGGETRGPGGKNMLIVLDALDEAGAPGTKPRKDLLQFLAGKLLALAPAWVRVLCTSRPEPDIILAFAKFDAHEIAESDEVGYINIILRAIRIWLGLGLGFEVGYINIILRAIRIIRRERRVRAEGVFAAHIIMWMRTASVRVMTIRNRCGCTGIRNIPVDADCLGSEVSP